MPSLVEIGSVVLEKDTFKISLFPYYLPKEKGVALHFYELNGLCRLVEIGPVVLEMKILNFIIIFSLYFHIISSWTRA